MFSSDDATQVTHGIDPRAHDECQGLLGVGVTLADRVYLSQTHHETIISKVTRYDPVELAAVRLLRTVTDFFLAQGREHYRSQVTGQAGDDGGHVNDATVRWRPQDVSVDGVLKQ